MTIGHAYMSTKVCKQCWHSESDMNLVSTLNNNSVFSVNISWILLKLEYHSLWIKKKESKHKFIRNRGSINYENFC